MGAEDECGVGGGGGTREKVEKCNGKRRRRRQLGSGERKGMSATFAERRGTDAKGALKIKMARIQRRFSETAFEMFAIFTKFPSLYILRRFRMTVVNMMS